VLASKLSFWPHQRFAFHWISQSDPGLVWPSTNSSHSRCFPCRTSARAIRCKTPPFLLFNSTPLPTRISPDQLLKSRHFESIGNGFYFFPRTNCNGPQNMEVKSPRLDLPPSESDLNDSLFFNRVVPNGNRHFPLSRIHSTSHADQIIQYGKYKCGSCH